MLGRLHRGGTSREEESRGTALEQRREHEVARGREDHGSEGGEGKGRGRRGGEDTAGRVVASRDTR